MSSRGCLCNRGVLPPLLENYVLLHLVPPDFILPQDMVKSRRFILSNFRKFINEFGDFAALIVLNNFSCGQSPRVSSSITKTKNTSSGQPMILSAAFRSTRSTYFSHTNQELRTQYVANYALCATRTNICFFSLKFTVFLSIMILHRNNALADYNALF